ncbi:uncharacterized protein [Antedon mediterranea]|uniref:uncharacterized protein n=1 Tax=Antedon mediterranea TaxID=105859 RepID=UPI003AF49F50
MAYIYGNAIHVSAAMFVLGFIQLLMWAACFFGCQVWGQYDYGIAVLAGVFAMWTGLYGVYMTKKTLDRRLGGGFLCSSIILILICACCIFLNTYSGLKEYEYITNMESSSEVPRDITGLVIYGTIDFFAIFLLVAACYASFMNCCCEPLPPKEFGFSYLNHEDQRGVSLVDANYV